MGYLLLKSDKKGSQQRKKSSKKEKDNKGMLIKEVREEIVLRKEGQHFLSLPANHHLAVLFSSL